jgi:hypothetical protein
MPDLLLTSPDLDITQELILLELEEALREAGPAEAPTRRHPATLPRQRTARPSDARVSARQWHLQADSEATKPPVRPTQRSPPHTTEPLMF